MSEKFNDLEIRKIIHEIELKKDNNGEPYYTIDFAIECSGVIRDRITAHYEYEIKGLEQEQKAAIQIMDEQIKSLSETIKQKDEALKELKRDCIDMSNSYRTSFLRCSKCGRLNDKEYICCYCKEV
jgi:hypothetical protein